MFKQCKTNYIPSAFKNVSSSGADKDRRIRVHLMIDSKLSSERLYTICSQKRNQSLYLHLLHHFFYKINILTILQGSVSESYGPNPAWETAKTRPEKLQCVKRFLRTRKSIKLNSVFSLIVRNKRISYTHKTFCTM